MMVFLVFFCPDVEILISKIRPPTFKQNHFHWCSIENYADELQQSHVQFSLELCCIHVVASSVDYKE